LEIALEKKIKILSLSQFANAMVQKKLSLEMCQSNKSEVLLFVDKRRIVPREKANLATLQFTFSKKMPQNFIFKGLKNVSDLFPF